MLLGNESGSLINSTRDICNKIMHIILRSHDSISFLLNFGNFDIALDALNTVIADKTIIIKQLKRKLNFKSRLNFKRRTEGYDKLRNHRKA